MSLKFRWGAGKSLSNLAKHGVSFSEATTAFYDPLSLTIPDPDHSEGETRFVLIGVSVRERTLVVVHTEEGDNVRIVSARRATRAERKAYEEG
ncbi:MAG: BrnT family toxin [Acidobacteriota bacterium]